VFIHSNFRNYRNVGQFEELRCDPAALPQIVTYHNANSVRPTAAVVMERLKGNFRFTLTLDVNPRALIAKALLALNSSCVEPSPHYIDKKDPIAMNCRIPSLTKKIVKLRELYNETPGSSARTSGEVRRSMDEATTHFSGSGGPGTGGGPGPHAGGGAPGPPGNQTYGQQQRLGYAPCLVGYYITIHTARISFRVRARLVPTGILIMGHKALVIVKNKGQRIRSIPMLKVSSLT
jgi:hypothetical protein